MKKPPLDRIKATPIVTQIPPHTRCRLFGIKVEFVAICVDYITTHMNTVEPDETNELVDAWRINLSGVHTSLYQNAMYEFIHYIPTPPELEFLTDLLFDRGIEVCATTHHPQTKSLTGWLVCRR